MLFEAGLPTMVERNFSLQKKKRKHKTEQNCQKINK